MASVLSWRPNKSSPGANSSDDQVETAPTIVLRGVPNDLEVRPIYRYRTTEDGDRIAVRTRRGLRKFTRVELTSADPAQAEAVVLDESERRFVLGAERRSWRAIERRYGQDAWNRCVALARAGVVRLRCDVTHEVELGQMIDWRLTTNWSAQRAERLSDRQAAQTETRRQALEAADAVEDISPEFARVLRDVSPHTPSLVAAIAVASDLRDGVVNASPRAFSQRHFGSTKAHDGVAHVLRRLGVPSWVADATGVQRSARIGVAGRIGVHARGAQFSASFLAGPLILRADQTDLAFTISGNGVALVLVENLQAAEALADVRTELAIVYTGGMPGRATLDRISDLASQAAEAWIATDADLGGVRISEQLLEAVPEAHLIDVGTVPHDPQPEWPPNSGYRRSLERAVTGAAGTLAEAVLERGYPLEQELLLVDAVAGVVPPSASHLRQRTARSG